MLNKPSAADSSIGTPILKKMSKGLHCELDGSSSHADLQLDWNGQLLCTGHWLTPFPIYSTLYDWRELLLHGCRWRKVTEQSSHHRVVQQRLTKNLSNGWK